MKALCAIDRAWPVFFGVVDGQVQQPGNSGQDEQTDQNLVGIQLELSAKLELKGGLSVDDEDWGRRKTLQLAQPSDGCDEVRATRGDVLVVKGDVLNPVEHGKGSRVHSAIEEDQNWFPDLSRRAYLLMDVTGGVTLRSEQREQCVASDDGITYLFCQHSAGLHIVIGTVGVDPHGLDLGSNPVDDPAVSAGVAEEDLSTGIRRLAHERSHRICGHCSSSQADIGYT
jgi:hypothetical protein